MSRDVRYYTADWSTGSDGWIDTSPDISITGAISYNGKTCIKINNSADSMILTITALVFSNPIIDVLNKAPPVF